MKFALSLLAGSIAAGLIGGVVLRESSPSQPSIPATPKWKPRNTLIREPVLSADDLDNQQPDAKAFRTQQFSDGQAVRSTVPVATSGGAYRNCHDAWAACAAPIYRGQPGYGAHMDGDHDGIACEPIRQ